MGWLTGKNKTTVINGAVDLVKGVRSMIDDSKFTPEEAMRANITIADKTAEFVGNTLSENTERSVTRRRIAVFFMYFFCSWIVSIALSWLFKKELAEFMLKLTSDLNLHWAFIAVIGFFFGSYTLRQYTGKKK